MSAVEIIAELPRLNEAELSKVRQKLKELDEHAELSGLHEAADVMFQEMDKQEAERANVL